LESRSLACADCGLQFEFPPDEQERFAHRGFSPPKRCKSCRQQKRRRQLERKGAPGDGEAPRAEAPPRRRGPAQKNAANCTVCGAATEVPFVPDGVRPIYCLPCLKQRTR